MNGNLEAKPDDVISLTTFLFFLKAGHIKSQIFEVDTDLSGCLR